MDEKVIREVCLAHHLKCNIINKLVGSFDKELFIIDDKYLIRTSKQSMLEEQNRINRVKGLKQAPKILYASDQSSTNSNLYYLILQYVPGCELLTNYHSIQERDIHKIGIEIADFLHELHNLKGKNYDIGHYIPIIPAYDKSWKSGHEIYWSDIYINLKNIQLSEAAQHLLEVSNEYIRSNIFCLEYENGPSLLHNDFHYKNIIMYNDAFSGVIDWECSQYGEADFDLIHLLHWCIFPPSKDMDMSQLFTTIFRSYMKKCSIPMIEKRLTIYLLEHDFIQILWSKGKRADELLERIEWWIEKLDQYIQNINN